METNISQAQIKDLKKRISEESAINIGYNNTVLQHLPEYALLKAVRASSEIANMNTPDADLLNILITESVKAMNYQDFKEIAKFFFGTHQAN